MTAHKSVATLVKACIALPPVLCAPGVSQRHGSSDGCVDLEWSSAVPLALVTSSATAPTSMLRFPTCPPHSVLRSKYDAYSHPISSSSGWASTLYLVVSKTSLT